MDSSEIYSTLPVLRVDVHGIFFPVTVNMFVGAVLKVGIAYEMELQPLHPERERDRESTERGEELARLASH